MSQSKQLIDTLKRELRRQRINYRQVANTLQLSEASVKRLFSGRRFTLDRLEKICDLAQLSIAELVQQVEKNVELTSELSVSQETALVADVKLLLVAYMLVNHQPFSSIIETYDITETEGIRLLAQLDRMKIIELQPGNRVRLLISANFKWITNGPIQRFFEQRIQSDFFDSAFDGNGEIRLFLSGMLSRDANAQILRRINHLARELNELVVESRNLTAEQCFGTSVFIAMRPWEVKVFNDLRRSENRKAF